MTTKSKWHLLVLFMMFMTIETRVIGQTHSSPITSYNINQIMYVDGIKYPQSPDIGVGIAAAYADLPSNGGTIVIPASATCYTMSTAVTFRTASKPVLIDGAGGACINYIATRGIAFTFDNGDLTNHFRSSGILDIVLNGPTSGMSTAILLGGTNGAEGFHLMNSRVNWPVSTGISFGNNTWGTLFDQSTITGTPGINFPIGTNNSGEDIELRDTFVQGQINNFTNCAIFNGGAGLQLSVIGGSFDDCQLTLQSGSLNVTDAHFENPGERADSLSNPFIVIDGNTTLEGIWLGQDAMNGVTTPQEILVLGNSQVTVFGGSFTSNATVTNLLTNAGSNVVYMSPTIVGGFTNHSNTTSAGRVSEFPVYGLAGIQFCTQFSSGTTCNQFPAITGTLSQEVVQYCGVTSGVTQSCAGKAVSVPLIIYGEVTLNGSASQSITALPFTVSTYSCSGSDLTNMAGIVSFNSYAKSSVTIAELGGGTVDHLRYQCVGY